MTKLPTVRKHGVDIPIYPGFTAIVKKYRNGTVFNNHQETRAQESTPLPGYQRGYWHQPELEGQSEEWKKGYLKGWNDRVLDRC